MESQSARSKGTFHKTFSLTIIITVIAVFLASSCVYYYRSGKKAAHAVIKPAQAQSLGMTGQTPAPLTDKQIQQLSAGTSTATTEKRFYITGGNFFFTPNTITVNQGDNVKLVFNNINGFHDFVINELGVKTTAIHAGQFVTASFTAAAKGTYVFYSDVPTDNQSGMKGTLIVQ